MKNIHVLATDQPSRLWINNLRRRLELDTDVLDRSMWNMYQTMKDDNFEFDGYSHEDKVMMVNHILPYFEKIGEYEVCKEPHDQITLNN